MRIFKQSPSKRKQDFKTTDGFFIGAPEAEAETSATSAMQLGEVFSDFLNILPRLRTEKFILLGRKGSGKTAIAEYIAGIASKDPNTFCDFVRRADFTLEDNVQENTGDEQDRATLLFEWLILIKMTRLIVTNNALQNAKEKEHLDKFLRKNAGYVDINEYDAKEFLSGKDFDIDITHFKRFFLAKFNKKLQITSTKAPFYKLLPSLKDTVLSLLSWTGDSENDNEYILIFDDLDIGFKASDERAVNSLVSLLRIAKHYNINEFGKRNIGAKIIILIRDDIAGIASGGHADTAKLFSSYGVWLTWYEHQDYQSGGEKNVTLRDFINKRIQYNFKKMGWAVSADPWSDLVQQRDKKTYGPKSAFKFVLDHTFYRPRDLILVFVPVSEMALKIPISSQNLSDLVIRYAREVLQEIRNELSARYSDSEIDSILSVLASFARKRAKFNFEVFKEKMRREGLSLDADSLVNHLFEYSLIGNMSKDGHITFKHRQERHEHFDIDLDQQLILHTSLIVHYSGRVWN